MKCCGYLISDHIDISKIESANPYKQTAILRLEENICFVFPYGVLVIWGDGELAPFEALIKKTMKNKFKVKDRIIDEFEVEQDGHTKLIHEDVFYLGSYDQEILLSISHGIAQSLRLSYLEDDVLRLMEFNKQIPLDLAQEGRIKKSKKEIAKLQGELYLKKSKMIFEYSILDKPEFFWGYPEYDDFYTKTIEYLELNQRIEILSKKFSTIDEILYILSGELNHLDSHRLEVIIILLILIEVIIFFLQDVFKVL